MAILQHLARLHHFFIIIIPKAPVTFKNDYGTIGLILFCRLAT